MSDKGCYEPNCFSTPVFSVGRSALQHATIEKLKKSFFDDCSDEHSLFLEELVNLAEESDSG